MEEQFYKGRNVYVSSDDSRYNGFNATITSVGRKYITAINMYGEKYKFDKSELYCVDWSIYRLEESVESYKKRLARLEKKKYISMYGDSLDLVLTEEEIDDIYERLKRRYGK